MVEIHAYLKIIYSIHTKNCCIGKKINAMFYTMDLVFVFRKIIFLFYKVFSHETAFTTTS